MTLEAELARGIEALGIPVTTEVERKLLEYVALVQKWNRVYNLTAIRDAGQMLSHHVLDSLCVVPHLAGERILDVGSGAGLPGIPLALALAQSSVTLLESNHKKAAFLAQVVIELAIGNVTIVNERVENWESGHSFDIVISRAFADVAEFVSLAGRHCAQHGALAAMKGVYPYEEIEQVPAGYRLRRVIPLQVPGLDAKRHLVLIERV
jgi:16S rRNA (guanine527-N7)-methyltransferase